MANRRLFVISDLHLGGKPDTKDDFGRLVPGTALCNSAPQLAAFFSWLCSTMQGNQDETFELVINGDIFDFLCELDSFVDPTMAPWYGDEELALRLALSLQKTYYFEASASPLFALRRFVQQGGKLTLLVGNHDIELSYPKVRAWLRQLLDADAGHVEFIYDGEAYSVGDVLIEHGNRYDSWNAIDHNALRQDRSLMSRGALSNSGFTPPPGSYLVTHVINRLKKQYRFVDLLKPETETVLPLLLTLCPAAVGVMQELLKVSPVVHRGRRFARGVEDGSTLEGGLLSAETSDESDISVLLSAVLGKDAELFADEIAHASATNDSAFLSVGDDICNAINHASRRLAAKVSVAATFASLLVPGSKSQVLARLRSALRKLNRVDLLAIDHEAGCYFGAATRITETGMFNVVIFGHTHLPKHVTWNDETSGERCTYINTGTWADLMRVPQSVLETENDDALEAFASDLVQNNYAQYIERYLTFAEVETDGKKARSAKLWRFIDAEQPRSVMQFSEEA